MAERLSEGPYGGRQYDYRMWMIERLEDETGSNLGELGNIHAGTLETLYKAVLKRSPAEQFKLEGKSRE